MTHLIVLRHGAYKEQSDEGGLTDVGISQIEEAVKRLRPIIEDRSLLVLGSPALRTMQSAAVIACAFGKRPEKHGILRSDNQPEDLPGTLELVKSREAEAEVIILVTHLEYAGRFPSHYAREILGTDYPEHIVEKGEGIVIDCLSKTVKPL